MTSFYDLKFQDENDNVQHLLSEIQAAKLNETEIEQHAHVMVEAMRKSRADLKGFNALIQTYNLTSDEGLALMTLAEALLRIPDPATANALISDKLSDGDWAELFNQAQDMTGRFSGFGLTLSQKMMDTMLGKVGMPFIRKACIEAMQLMGKTFVLGRDIDEAMKAAKDGRAKGYIYNYDMLGEGARTFSDADFYYESYRQAVQAVGEAVQSNALDAPYAQGGVSVKLSALYPRYDYAHENEALAFLIKRLLTLCELAAGYNITLTIDAEECDRLAISLKVIEAVLQNPIVKNWKGFGLAIQAYQKRAYTLIDKVIEWTKIYECRLHVRLVKGAYWDTEIKHAQVEGYEGYPVFTRKDNTDLSYLACAYKLLQNRDALYPLFGTHNAHSVAAIINMAGADKGGFMFQRLHGMGVQLYDQIIAQDIPVGVYAPVGTHKYLLAYLVRRLLENGANSSFVNQIYDLKIPIDELIQSPIQTIMAREEQGQSHTHEKIPLPADIYSNRKNAKGYDLSEDAPYHRLARAIESYGERNYQAHSIINGESVQKGALYEIKSPSNQQDIIGRGSNADEALINQTYQSVSQAFYSWRDRPIEDRAIILENIADAYEKNGDEIIALLIREAGKTIPDAVAELREAVDFCRYYAVQARLTLGKTEMEGPTGERNILYHEGRGVFVCISPWNFPFAIFTGQIVAALVSGNCVIAKPAEQTPAIATLAVQLMIKAGLPRDVIALLQGDGAIGETIINHNQVAGVAFTGSTQVAKIIQRQLAAKEGAILPLIAETGGLNAMIVDSTALPEQVTDDVINSAFGSAGQRCSALRILCLQDDVADEMITMIKGAIACLIVGDPAYLSTDVGPIIDAEAKTNLEVYLETLNIADSGMTFAPIDERLGSYGHFFQPVMIEMDSIEYIKQEAFGPILHVLRYKQGELDSLIGAINAKGYGLTFGLHSRIHRRQDMIIRKINAGNIYINRGQTGAVVGVQPFGGRGLSGTGPKAGGPNYLYAFTHEKAVSDDITASGGNATLINL